MPTSSRLLPLLQWSIIHRMLGNGLGHVKVREHRYVCQSVEEIYHCLGPIYLHRAYQMSYDSFWRLHNLLEVKIEEAAAMI
jgi:hypothetical protein